MTAIDLPPHKRPYSHLPEHLPFLDGIRGIAALWVMLSHIQILSGMQSIPLLSYGELAVDLFMVMSGLLMAHHYLLRQPKEPWEVPKSWCIFWIRRFFRIAPLYYLLLLVALLAGEPLGEYRNAIASHWPQAATNIHRYTDHGINNILAHLTFIFGGFPQFAYETPLPDWSIGLEMQFYLAFPFLMIVVGRIGVTAASVIAIAFSLALELGFKGYFTSFEMPSVLPMKLYMFMCGILIAVIRDKRSMLPSLLIAVAAATLYALREQTAPSVMRVVMVLVVFYILDEASLPTFPLLRQALQRLRQALGGRLGHFLGEMSYCVYLVHLLILIPVAGMLANYAAYVHAPQSLRYLACAVIVVPVVYALSAIAHHVIEQRGIRLGKAIIRSLSY